MDVYTLVRALALVLFALASVARADELLRPFPEHVPFPAGLADPDLTRAYVTGPSGGLDAIDLATGRLAWSQPGACLPAALWKDGLVAVEQVVRGPSGGPSGERLVLLARADGALRARGDTLGPLSRWGRTHSDLDVRPEPAGYTIRLITTEDQSSGIMHRPPMVTTQHFVLDSSLHKVTEGNAARLKWEAAARSPLATGSGPAAAPGGADGMTSVLLAGLRIDLVVQRSVEDAQLTWTSIDPSGRTSGPVLLCAAMSLATELSMDGRLVRVTSRGRDNRARHALYATRTGRQVGEVPRWQTSAGFVGQGKRRHQRERSDGFVGRGKRLYRMEHGSPSGMQSGPVPAALHAFDLEFNELWLRNVWGGDFSPPQP